MDAYMPSAVAIQPQYHHQQEGARATTTGTTMDSAFCKGISTPPTTPPSLAATRVHPAWSQLTELAKTNLAWRRAACQDNDACAISELARGGLLQILQCAGLAVPLGTKGAVNAYVTANLIEDLGRAVQVYLATTNDPFYAVCPKENVNYGGKGAGQQLWWSTKAKGWRVTQPNRHMMAQISGVPAQVPRRAARARPLSDGTDRPQTKTKRQRVPQTHVINVEETPAEFNPISISDEEICLLPLHEDDLDTFGSKQTQELQQAEHQQAFSESSDCSPDSEDSPWIAEDSIPFSRASSYMLFDPLYRGGSETPEVHEANDDMLQHTHQSIFVEHTDQQHGASDALHTPWSIEVACGVSYAGC